MPSKTGSHLSAETILERVRAQLPGVSLGTIYRTLDILRGIGLVQIFSHAGGAAKYEAALEKHHHLVCTHCGEVVNVNVNEALALSQSDRAGARFQRRRLRAGRHRPLQALRRRSAQRERLARPLPRLTDLDPAGTHGPSSNASTPHVAAMHTGHVRGPVGDRAARSRRRSSTRTRSTSASASSTKLGKRLFELMVLVVARHWTSQFEWHTHEKYAREFGISDAAIEAIRTHGVPALRTGRRTDRLRRRDANCSETKALGEATYARALAAFGEELLVELISAAGLYTMVAMLLNAFDVPVPEGARRLA